MRLIKPYFYCLLFEKAWYNYHKNTEENENRVSIQEWEISPQLKANGCINLYEWTENSWNQILTLWIIMKCLHCAESALQIKDLTYGTIIIQFHLPSFSSSSTRAIRNQTPQLKTVAGHLSQCLWFLMSNSWYYFHRPNKQQSNYTSEHIRSRYVLISLNNITSPINGKADSASPRWQP